MAGCWQCPRSPASSRHCRRCVDRRRSTASCWWPRVRKLGRRHSQGCRPAGDSISLPAAPFRGVRMRLLALQNLHTPNGGHLRDCPDELQLACHRRTGMQRMALVVVCTAMQSHCTCTGQSHATVSPDDLTQSARSAQAAASRARSCSASHCWVVAATRTAAVACACAGHCPPQLQQRERCVWSAQQRRRLCDSRRSWQCSVAQCQRRDYCIGASGRRSSHCCNKQRC